MRKVAIVGGGKSWIRTPFPDDSWETWVHSSCFEGIHTRRVDRWYEVHRPEVRAEAKKWSDRYASWLTNPDAEGRTAPVYVLDGFTPAKEGVPTIENHEIPNHHVIPWRAMQEHLAERGATEREYVTSTGAWMLRQAICERVDLVGIWGIDYEEEGEYLVQRPCMEHWIGFARALGIKVYVTPTSPLGRDDHIYGYDGYRPDLVHTHRPYKLGRRAQPISVLQAMGHEPMRSVPPEIQKLIDEEIARGIDTEAEWRKAAGMR
jgi:hypothetical protein